MLVENSTFSENLDSFSTNAPFKIFNIGYGKPIELMKFIKILEDTLGIKSKKEFVSMQMGDVKNTFANTTELQKWIGYKPIVDVEEGVKKFCKWFLKYYS